MLWQANSSPLACIVDATQPAALCSGKLLSSYLFYWSSTLTLALTKKNSAAEVILLCHFIMILL